MQLTCCSSDRTDSIKCWAHQRVSSRLINLVSGQPDWSHELLIHPRRGGCCDAFIWWDCYCALIDYSAKLLDALALHIFFVFGHAHELPKEVLFGGILRLSILLKDIDKISFLLSLLMLLNDSIFVLINITVILSTFPFTHLLLFFLFIILFINYILALWLRVLTIHELY